MYQTEEYNNIVSYGDFIRKRASYPTPTFTSSHMNSNFSIANSLFLRPKTHHENAAHSDVDEVTGHN